MKTIQQIAHEKYLIALNLYRFMCGEAFSTAWQYASSTEKEELVNSINNCTVNIERTELWVKVILKKHNLLEYLDLNYLKEIAKDLGVVNYYSFNKTILIGKIYAKQEKAKIDKETDTKGNVGVDI